MYDVVVIGAGPAGTNAAMDCHENGLRVLLIDEGRDAGGQVWRPKSKSILKAPLTSTAAKGEELREKLSRSEVEQKFQCRVWQIEKRDDGNWLLGITEPGEERQITSRAIIIATGAQERVIPVRGWTLPGVLGLAGATAVMKEHMIPPRGRTVVAGTGPLVFFVAHEIKRLGGDVAAIVTLNSAWDWMKSLPAMLLQPLLLLQGFGWISSLYLKRIPIYWKSGLKSIEGNGSVEGVTLTKVDSKWVPKGNDETYFPAENVCYGQGLMPAIEATQLIGADHHYDTALGGWVPTTDDMGRTSVTGIYVCGDNAGILGVTVAPEKGKLVADAVTRDLIGKIKKPASVPNIKFGRVMTALSIPRKGLIKFIDDDVEVCRCEGISRREVENEITGGAKSHNAVKSGTRCGMGPCGGRFCMDTVAMIAEQQTGKSRAEIGLPTARPPLRPVVMSELSEDLDYEDLPIPGVSPL